MHVDIVVNIIDESAMKLFGGKCDHKRHYHRQFIEKISPKSLYVTDNVDDRFMFKPFSREWNVEGSYEIDSIQSKKHTHTNTPSFR